MPVSNTPTVERVARILAAQIARRKGDGDGATGHQVDETWPQYTEDAVEILKTLREPDTTMAQAGNVVNWQSMVLAAIDGAAGHARRSNR